ncbi:hypothetical protein ACU8KH_03375 [Lachancea thermotolerans]
MPVFKGTLLLYLPFVGMIKTDCVVYCPVSKQNKLNSLRPSWFDTNFREEAIEIELEKRSMCPNY